MPRRPHPFMTAPKKGASLWLFQDNLRFHSKEVFVDSMQGYSVHLHKSFREQQFHYCVKKIAHAAKHVGADLLELAWPENPIVGGCKKFKKVGMSVGR